MVADAFTKFDVVWIMCAVDSKGSLIVKWWRIAKIQDITL